jgi:hypothetical protein
MAWHSDRNASERVDKYIMWLVTNNQHEVHGMYNIKKVYMVEHFLLQWHIIQPHRGNSATNELEQKGVNCVVSVPVDLHSVPVACIWVLSYSVPVACIWVLSYSVPVACIWVLSYSVPVSSIWVLSYSVPVSSIWVLSYSVPVSSIWVLLYSVPVSSIWVLPYSVPVACIWVRLYSVPVSSIWVLSYSVPVSSIWVLSYSVPVSSIWVLFYSVPVACIWVISASNLGPQMLPELAISWFYSVRVNSGLMVFKVRHNWTFLFHSNWSLTVICLLSNRMQ